jgi:hypothetical protein
MQTCHSVMLYIHCSSCLRWWQSCFYGIPLAFLLWDNLTRVGLIVDLSLVPRLIAGALPLSPHRSLWCGVVFNHRSNFVFVTFYCYNNGLSDMVLLWQVLSSSGYVSSLSQMPIVLIPVHFDRDQVSRIPSCQRSVVLRPFCSHDFMTGVPAIPGRELPVDVSVTRIFISVMHCTYLYLHCNFTGSCYIICMHMEAL